VFAAQSLLLITLGFFKLSFAFLLRRLSPPTHHTLLMVNTGVMALVGVGIVLCIIAVRADCSSSHYLSNPQSSCPEQVRLVSA